MSYFNFNGKMLSEDTLIAGPDNRGLRYGDGVFETLKYKNGQLILADEHFVRLWSGMKLLQLNFSKNFTPEYLQHEALELLKKNRHDSARVRISIIRGSGGLYDLVDPLATYIIQSWPLTFDENYLNEHGLQLCIYTAAKKSIDSFSALKHNNFLPYFMAALNAKQRHCNDAVVLNNFERVCDTSMANIFLVKNQTIYTPALYEGCIGGIMRRFIIQQLSKSGYDIRETEIKIATLLDADEVFLTNSIYNMRWVSSIDDKKYRNAGIRKIYELLQQTNPGVFC